MKTIKARELNALEVCQLRDYLQNCISDSIKANREPEYTDWYKDCTFEDYQDNLIQAIYDHDDEDLGDGISIITLNVLILDRKDSKIINEIFIEARNNAYNEYEEELTE